MVQEPGFLTLTAALVRMAWSRSVAVMLSRSPSASSRKLERIGIVVLRSTTLCVAVSSFTSSWRLTVISIAAPCAAGFSTSVSTIDIHPPLVAAAVRGRPVERDFHAGHTLQQQTLARIRLSLLVLDCIHVCGSKASVENKAAAWKQRLDLANGWDEV